MKRNAAARKFAKQVGDRTGDIELQNMAFDGFVAGYDFCETKQPSRLEIAARIASGIVSGDSTTLTCKTEGGVRGVNVSYAYDFSKIARNALKLTDELIRQEAETSQKP